MRAPDPRRRKGSEWRCSVVRWETIPKRRPQLSSHQIEPRQPSAAAAGSRARAASRLPSQPHQGSGHKHGVMRHETSAFSDRPTVQICCATLTARRPAITAREALVGAPGAAEPQERMYPCDRSKVRLPMCGTSWAHRLIGAGLVAALCGPGAHNDSRPSLAPCLAVAAPSRQVQVDLDGDRVPDRGTIVSATQIRLRLTQSGREQVLIAPRALVGLVAADINRDGAFDLVASLTDGSLIVWLNDGHGRLDRARPRTPSSGPAVARSPLLRTGFAFFTAIVVRDGLLGPTSRSGGPAWAIADRAPQGTESTPRSTDTGRSGRAPPISHL